MNNVLIIQHQQNIEEKQSFKVIRQSDGKTSGRVSLTAPYQVRVEGRPNSHLMQDLRWYLEDYLTLPTGAYPELAERILDTLRQWGEETFCNLFTNCTRGWYQEIRQTNLSKLTLKIASDDPAILSWPWEALCDPEGTTLAHVCRIERQLSQLHDPLPLSQGLPHDRINILLIISRPYGDQDVGYHALSRPIIELSRQQDSPVNIHLLRPPTFEQLQAELSNKQGFYHIVHFDGHGGYDSDIDVSLKPSRTTFKGAQGKLIFESSVGGEYPVAANQLTPLLSEYQIPIMVLNACQSARIEQSEDPFASVAGSLIKAGIRSVIGMSYNLWVSSAQEFFPAFYQRLFNCGDVSEAMRAGRKNMLSRPHRTSPLGNTRLQDWLVPILYQQDPLILNFANTTKPSAASLPTLPDEALQIGDYGFIGRDYAIHALERALQRQPQAGILINGISGIGKTALVRGFLHWLRDTNGLVDQVFWFNFNDIQSFDFVINKLVEVLFGRQDNATTQEDK